MNNISINYRTIPDSFVEKAAEALIGTCMDTFEQHLAYELNEANFFPFEVEEMMLEFGSYPEHWYTIMDELVFSCQHCGWWCEAGDNHSYSGGDWEADEICSECYDTCVEEHGEEDY